MTTAPAQAWDNLSDPVFHYAATRPDALALIEGREALCYRDLADFVAKASVYLRELGIAEGERVGVALTNSIDHIVLDFALFRIGAVLVELSADDDPDALAATARRYGIRTVFTEPHLPPPPGLRCIRVDVAWRAQLATKAGDQRSAAPADALEILGHTTGSTGLPSGFIWTQRQTLERIALRVGFYYPDGVPARPADLLLTASMRFGWFFTCALTQLALGGTLVLLSEGLKAPDLLRAIAAWDGALACVTANMCRFFASVAPAQGLLLPRLYLLESAGLPLFTEDRRAILARVAPSFLESYGTAGIGTISALSRAEVALKPDSVGRPLPTLVVQIVDEADRALPTGTFGRIRCRGALMSRPCPENAGGPGGEYMRGGWYYPGDIGMLDAEGYLHLRGRIADMVRRGAREIDTAEIEAVMASLPGVAEVAVLGVPVQDLGHEIVVFVVRRDSALAHDAVVAHCRAQLPPERRPDRVVYIDALPRIGGGKVDRLRLVEQAVIETARMAPRADRRDG